MAESPSSKQNPDSAESERSGGVDINADTVNVGGDVVGGNKINVPIVPLIAALGIGLAVLIFIALMASRTQQQVQQILPTPPPDEMTGDFNVAVTEFGVVDTNGNPIDSPDGKALAKWIHDQVEKGLSDPDIQRLLGSYELWPPERTGHIAGNTPEERAAAAAELAGRIKANLIIYGVVTQTGQLAPEFYVEAKGFEQGQELIGPHALGSPLGVELPFKPALHGLANPALTARLNALNLITIGLAALFIERPQVAIDYFQQAEQIQEWVDSAGKEIVYLLDGDANLQRASMGKTSSPLIAATEAFSKALDINPNYARAELGLAGVKYLQALTDPTNINPSTVDLDKLDEAERAFKHAGTLQAPPSANVSIKIAFGLGQVYLVRGGILSDSEQLARARSEFEAVINDYLSSAPRDQLLLEDMAGQAYARLGLLARLQRDWPTAIDYYRQAIPHVTPSNKADYNAALGEIYLEQGNTTEAIKAYDAAQSIAESNGDHTRHDKYLAILKKIQGGQ